MSSRRYAASIAILICGLVSTSCITTRDEQAVSNDEASISNTGEPSPYQFQPIAPCLSKEDYEPRGVVTFGWGHQVYTPPCATFASGGGATLIFQGPFDEHPLVPRPLGNTPSPIVATSGGGLAEFEFTSAGFFPYRCAAHPDEIGVLWAY